MSNTTRFYNDQTLASLVDSASESAKVNQSGEPYFPIEIANEINDLPTEQALFVIGQVKYRLSQRFNEIAFQMNLQGMGFREEPNGQIQPIAANWAHRRAKESKTERTNKIFSAWSWPIFCAACLLAGVMFYLHKNGQQIRFDKNAAIEAKR